MSKVADYLQEHLVGEVMTSVDARRTLLPMRVFLPYSPRLLCILVMKTTFAKQLDLRGNSLNVIDPYRLLHADWVATKQALHWAAELSWFSCAPTSYFRAIGESGEVTVEPGINYGKLQQTLLTHGRFLPCYPSSLEYSTVGGAVANNKAGERSFKYGSTREFTKRLRVVLANGEVIETRRLSKRELTKNSGLVVWKAKSIVGSTCS